MKKTFSRTTAATVCASLMLSGTCLAMPALAVAAGSGSGPLAALAGAADAVEEQAEATEVPAEKAEVISSVDAPADGAASASKAADATNTHAQEQTVTAGGLQVTVPSDYTVADLGGALVMAISPNEDVAVTLMPLGLGASDIAELPTDEAELTALFDELAEQMVASLSDSDDASVGSLELTDSDVAALPGGEQVYSYLFEGTVMDEPLTIGQYLVVLEDDIVMLQLTASGEMTDEVTSQLAAIEESVAVAPKDANGSSLAATPAPAAATEDETVEVDGIKITVPSSLIYDESSDPSEPAWYDADDTVMLGVIADLTEGEPTDRTANDAIAAALIEQLGAQAVSTDEFTTDGGVDVVLYSFGMADEDGDFVGLLGLVQPEPNQLTAVLAIVTLDASEEMVEAVEQAYYSIELA